MPGGHGLDQVARERHAGRDREATAFATFSIADGVLIRVDGDAGEVTVLG
jgi:hypothetical protein